MTVWILVIPNWDQAISDTDSKGDTLLEKRLDVEL